MGVLRETFSEPVATDVVLADCLISSDELSLANENHDEKGRFASGPSSSPSLVQEFHGTRLALVSKILSEGIKPSSPIDSGNYAAIDVQKQPTGVYLAPNFSEALFWGRAVSTTSHDVVVFEVQVPKEEVHRDPMVAKACYVKRTITPAEIVAMNHVHTEWQGAKKVETIKREVVKDGKIVLSHDNTYFVPIRVHDKSLSLSNPNHDERGRFASGDSYFNERALNELQNQGPKSRSIVVHMTPEDFLKVAEQLHNPQGSESKRATVQSVLDRGEKFESIPHLSFEHDGKGNAYVVGHEGRHRALKLKSLGVTSIPVELRSQYNAKRGGSSIRWGQQSEVDENHPDYVKGVWPHTLHSQTEGFASIPFPVEDLRTKDKEVEASLEIPLELGNPNHDEKGKFTTSEYAKNPRVFAKPSDTKEINDWGNKANVWKEGTSQAGFNVQGRILTKAELPQVLYHATVAKPAVEGTGVLLGKNELHGGALGGGGDAGVSLTTSKDDAELIARELKRRVLIGHGVIKSKADFENMAREDEKIAGMKEGSLQPAVEEAFRGERTEDEIRRYNQQYHPNATEADVQKGKRSALMDAQNMYLTCRASIAKGSWNKGVPQASPEGIEKIKNPILYTSRDLAETMDPNAIGVVAVNKKMIPDDALITSGSDDFLHEVRIYADVPLPKRVGNERFGYNYDLEASLDLLNPDTNRGVRGVASLELSLVTFDDIHNATINKAANDTDINPTPEQRKEGNYKKGRCRVQGLAIAIENPKGSERKGVGPDGKPWSVVMKSHYGYVYGIDGKWAPKSEADGDAVDVFLGPNPTSKMVYVIDQTKPATGEWDECKCMVGYPSLDAAVKAYHASYSKNWNGFADVTPMSMDTFKAWVESGDTSKPAGLMKSGTPIELANPNHDELGRFTTKDINGKDIPKPPETLYHVTFSPKEIKEQGFKTGAQSGKWILGSGDKRDYVSFTTAENAKLYRQGMHDAYNAAAGLFDPTDKSSMRVLGSRYGVKKSRMDEIVGDILHRYPKEDNPTQMFEIMQQMSFLGKKFPLFMGGHWPQSLIDANDAPVIMSAKVGPDAKLSYNEHEKEWRVHNPESIPKESIKNHGNEIEASLDIPIELSNENHDEHGRFASRGEGGVDEESLETSARIAAPDIDKASKLIDDWYSILLKDDRSWAKHDKVIMNDVSEKFGFSTKEELFAYARNLANRTEEGKRVGKALEAWFDEGYGKSTYDAMLLGSKEGLAGVLHELSGRQMEPTDIRRVDSHISQTMNVGEEFKLPTPASFTVHDSPGAFYGASIVVLGATHGTRVSALAKEFDEGEILHYSPGGYRIERVERSNPDPRVGAPTYYVREIPKSKSFTFSKATIKPLPFELSNENHDEHGRFASNQVDKIKALGLPEDVQLADSSIRDCISGVGNYKLEPKEKSYPTRDSLFFRIIPKNMSGMTPVPDREGKYYDPKIAEVKTQDDSQMQAVLGSTVTLKPDSGYTEDIQATPKEGVVFRGMSMGEIQNAKKNGEFQSMGDYNLGDREKGLTFYSTDPEQASSYATSFAPWVFLPAPQASGYVVEVKAPGKANLERGDERGFKDKVKWSDVIAIHEAKAYLIKEGEVELCHDRGNKWSEGSRRSPGVGVAWKKHNPNDLTLSLMEVELELADENHDEKGRFTWAENAVVPNAPGTEPIPKDHIRLYHYTKPASWLGAKEGGYTSTDTHLVADMIKSQGLDSNHSTGGKGGEGPSGVLWASTTPPDKGHTFVEFHIHKDDPRWADGSASGRADAEEYMKQNNHAILEGKINPEDIIAVHEPWHNSYRYMKQNELEDRAKAGEFDRLLTKDKEGPAVTKIKAEKSIQASLEQHLHTSDLLGDKPAKMAGRALRVPITLNVGNPNHDELGKFTSSEHLAADKGGSTGDGAIYGGWKPNWQTNPKPEAFIEQRNKTSRPGYLSHLEPKDLIDHKLFLSADGKVGVALSKEGDIQNLFNNGGPKGAAVEAIISAINHGGYTLDCFDGHLPDLYQQCGFEQTGRMKFNPEFAPKDWDYKKDDEPDVVFMALTEGRYEDDAIRKQTQQDKQEWSSIRRSNQYYSDYDEAKADSRRISRPEPSSGSERLSLGGSTRRPMPLGGRKLLAPSVPLWDLRDIPKGEYKAFQEYVLSHTNGELVDIPLKEVSRLQREWKSLRLSQEDSDKQIRDYLDKNNGHGVIKCSCGKLIRQCRCMTVHTPLVVKDACEGCKSKSNIASVAMHDAFTLSDEGTCTVCKEPWSKCLGRHGSKPCACGSGKPRNRCTCPGGTPDKDALTKGPAKQKIKSYEMLAVMSLDIPIELANPNHDEKGKFARGSSESISVDKKSGVPVLALKYGKKIYKIRPDKDTLQEVTDWQESRFEVLSRTEGKPIDTLKEEWSEAVQQACDKARMFIAVDPLVFNSSILLRDGRFKGVGEIGYSGGVDGLVDKDYRVDAEKAMFGIPANAPRAMRPISGYLSEIDPYREQSIKYDADNQAACQGYGHVAVELKDDCRSRSTVTFGDSLNEAQDQLLALPVTHADYRCLNVGRYDASFKDITDSRSVDSAAKRNTYAEIQVHGGVKLSDIKMVWYETEPSDDIKRALADKHVPWCVKPYHKGDKAIAASLDLELSRKPKLTYLGMQAKVWADDARKIQLSDTHINQNDDGVHAIDFDATLVKSLVPFDPKRIGEPIPERIAKVKQALKEGKKLCIFTARVHNDKDGHVKRMIQAWCKKYLGTVLEVTNEKRYDMVQFIDDKADGVKPDGTDFPELSLELANANHDEKGRFATASIPERNENFGNWFGDSQVVDSTGKPLVVYHGTVANEDFHEFKGKHRKDEMLSFGIHFSQDPEFASEYAKDDVSSRKGKNPRLKAVYLSAQNVLNADQIVTEGSKEFDLAKKLMGNRLNRIVQHNEDGKAMCYLQVAMDGTSGKRAEKIIQDAGYDGVRYNAVISGGGGWRPVGSGRAIAKESTAYLVFKPEQIKSATGNIGTFDKHNKDIRASLDVAIKLANSNHDELGRFSTTEKAIGNLEKLPVTNEPDKAIYLKPSGDMVDGSQGNSYRTLAHTYAAGGAKEMDAAIESGYIRFQPETNSLEIGKEPSIEQYEKIHDLLNERHLKKPFSAELRDGPISGNPKRPAIKKWDKSTSAETILTDLKNYYRKTPKATHVPTMAEMFHVAASQGVIYSLSAGESVFVMGIPNIRQPGNFQCGACAGYAVGHGKFKKGPADINQWFKALGTSVEKSTNPFTLAKYLRSFGLRVETSQNLTLEDLIAAIRMDKVPIICYQDYRGVESHTTHKYGHYGVGVEITPTFVILQDSSMQNALGVPGGSVTKSNEECDKNIAAPGRKAIYIQDFLKAWHDVTADGKKLDHFAIIVSNPNNKQEIKMSLDVPLELTKDIPLELADDDGGRWITVHGQAIHIIAGKDIGEAIKEHFASLKDDATKDKPSVAEVAKSPSVHPIALEPVTAPPPGRYYAPNVEATDSLGVTKAARVGVCGECTPPPPRIPRLPNLSKEERTVEDEFASAYEKNPKALVDAYKERVIANQKPGVPLTFETDDAKNLYSRWKGEGMSLEERSNFRQQFNTPLHQTANAIVKKAFLEHLDTLKKGDEIMVTVGGCGAGKGWVLDPNEKVAPALEMMGRSKAIWDSAGDQNSTENPWIQKEAEKRGLKVNYIHVDANPQSRWADPKFGVVQRAGNPKDGRMVDAEVFADSYAIGNKNHQAFYETNKDNPNANFVFVNARGSKPVVQAGISKDGLSLDRDSLKSFAVNTVAKRDDLKPEVRRGALVGQRIWKEGTK